MHQRTAFAQSLSFKWGWVTLLTLCWDLRPTASLWPSLFPFSVRASKGANYANVARPSKSSQLTEFPFCWIWGRAQRDCSLLLGTIIRQEWKFLGILLMSRDHNSRNLSTFWPCSCCWCCRRQCWRSHLHLLGHQQRGPPQGSPPPSSLALPKHAAMQPSA